MIAFANADGLLLDIIIRPREHFSEPFPTQHAFGQALLDGKVFAVTTHDLGTAAHLKRAIVVHGREHFLFSDYKQSHLSSRHQFATDGE